MVNLYSQRQRGFTLIEMSIVLVIIGLIIGGILKGQELIESSRQKNLTNQLDAIRSATNTFTDRYRAFPGDFGASATAIGAQTLGGNDDGIAAEVAAYQVNIAGILTINGAAADGEEKEFFNHLAAANLLGGVAVLAHGTAAANFSGGTTPSPLPQSAFPQSGFTITYGTHESSTVSPQAITTHWLRLSRFVAGAITAAHAVLSPQRAAQLDLKFDDGLPEGGRIRSGNVSNSATATDCGAVGTNAWASTVPTVACVLVFAID